MNYFNQFVAEYILIPRAHAASEQFYALLGRINEQVINPLIWIMFAAAFVLFTVGLYNLFGSGKGGEDLEKGKRHLVWGIIGMAIMVSVFGIMNFITGSLGISDVNPSGTNDASVLIQPR